MTAKNQPASTPLKVGIISLGCAKNLVDAEVMLGSLLQAGMKITNEAENADVVIVNTCSFIDAAQEESIDAILQADQLREHRSEDQALVVSGCLPQRFREELPKLLPEVDAFMGIDQVAEVSRIVEQAWASRCAKTSSNRKQSLSGSVIRARTRNPRSLRPRSSVAPSAILPSVEVNSRPSYIPDYSTPRLRLTPDHFAYVKIAEGCNHPCSFCTIPRMRGTHRSRRQADIVAEVKNLIAEGVKEINLISQDSTYYGMDFRPRGRSIASPERFAAQMNALPADATSLNTLLEELNSLEGDFWIRLLYTHPAHWTDSLIQTIAQCKKVARYIDIPLQHIDDAMLHRMRRETSREHIENLIARIRAGIPGIAIRTTFIVGFPGESDSAFETLLDFVCRTRFERLGVFTYSREEGTLAGKMEQQVEPKLKERRRRRLMEKQRIISKELNAAWVGKEMKVLIEGCSSSIELNQSKVLSWEHGLMRGGKAGSSKSKARSETKALDPRESETISRARSEADAPDIDGKVYVQGALAPGRFATVKITGHGEYDLMAVPL